MSAASPTSVTVLTPAGRSAVAVIEVRGPGAVSAVDACFRPAAGRSLEHGRLNAIRFGRWLSEAGEEVVVCRREDQVVEVHCHGGAAAIRAAVESLVTRGCVALPWAQSARTQERSVAQMAADLALRQAKTERTAVILLDQASGALEAGLRAAAGELAAGESATLDNMLRWAEFGPRVATGWRVVLAGAPNVGKSSLINAMLGFARSIVYDQPGTTRDVVTAQAAVEGWPVEFSDTAGIRASEDEIESAGAELAREAALGADLVLDVRDATRGPSDPGALGGLALKNRLVVWNKVDLIADQSKFAGIATSATQGAGIPELLQQIAHSIAPVIPSRGQAVPISNNLLVALRDAEHLRKQGALSDAKQRLMALLAPGLAE